MTTSMPYGYFDRTDTTKNYEKHLFIAGAGLQSAELNEIQEYATNRLRSVSDSLFKDGDIVRDAALVVNAETGDVTAQAGAIYVRGAVRGVAPRSFTISTSGAVTVGIYLVETVVTALEDAELRDPAAGTRNYQEPGAARLRVVPVWGWSGERTDSDFFPVYEIIDGVLSAKEAPPSMDGVTQAIARYDRDSAGGSYVVSGLQCQQLPNDANGNQVFSVSEGKARVRGNGLEFQTSTRVVSAPEPDLKFIDAEPHTSTTAGAQRIVTDRYPIANVTQVRITAEKTVTLTHGAFSGAQDQLPDTSILSIQSVSQGGTTYIQNTDYKLTSGKVDWSLTGAEPAPGSTYSVTYRYITTVAPTDVDFSGLTVTGAVVGTLVLVSYNQSLPRYDRICVSEAGVIVYVKGVSADLNPRVPDVPESLLGLATVYQTWDNKSVLTNDSVRVVPMNELAAINSRIDYVLSLVAQQRLESNINLREAGAKKGLFVDPFLDDSQRDAGVSQTGAVFDGILTLPVTANVTRVDSRGANGVSFLDKTDVASVQQLARTGSMAVNPYQSFATVTLPAVLTPSIDRWTEHQTVWTSAVTRNILLGSGNTSTSTTATSIETLSTQRLTQTKLRQIEVAFSITGFGSGESLSSVTFDGIAVTPVAI